MSAIDLFSMWPEKIANSWRLLMLKHTLRQANRDLEVIENQISEALKTKRFLNIIIMNLRIQLKDGK